VRGWFGGAAGASGILSFCRCTSCGRQFSSKSFDFVLRIMEIGGQRFVFDSETGVLSLELDELGAD